MKKCPMCKGAGVVNGPLLTDKCGRCGWAYGSHAAGPKAYCPSRRDESCMISKGLTFRARRPSRPEGER